MPDDLAEIKGMLHEIKIEQARQYSICELQCSRLNELFTIVVGPHGDNGLAGRLSKLEQAVGTHHTQETTDDLPTRVAVLETTSSRWNRWMAILAAMAGALAAFMGIKNG